MPQREDAGIRLATKPALIVITPRLSWRRASWSRVSAWRAPAAAVLAALVAAVAPDPADADDRAAVALQLVLAVDVSASIDAEEYRLQRQGIAAALRDPVVAHAVAATGDAAENGVAIAVMQWSGPAMQTVAIDWTRVDGPGSLEPLADRIAAMPRAFAGGDTRIGPAIDFAARMIRDARYRGRRRVIDISGDGGAESLGMTREARDRAVARGLVINGLPVENVVADLADFYRTNVIGGDSAFVLPAHNFEDFARAMRRKLLREIGGRPLAAAPAR